MADSPLAPEPPAGDGGPNQQCPNCDAIDVGFATQTEFFVYLRCNLCGEVWSFPERRLVRRAQAGGRFVSPRSE
jgi:hypothetical protein